MDQPTHVSKEPSPVDHAPKSSPAPAPLLPEMSAESVNERHPILGASHSELSSPSEPFPELDLEVGAEPNPSPTFTHEADMRISPAALSLPGPALSRMREFETGPVVITRVKWEQEEESEEEHGDMKEATARALEWARKMFGKDAERRVEGGEGSGKGNEE